MEKKLFREKSLERVTSPESLTDYMRVTTPNVWIVLSAVILFLVGVCCWGIFGRLETKTDTVIMSDGTAMYAIVLENDIDKIGAGNEIKIEDRTYTVTGVSSNVFELNENDSSYLIHLFGKEGNCWVTLIGISDSYVNESGATRYDLLAEGTYKGVIITDSVSPMSFVTN